VGAQAGVLRVGAQAGVVLLLLVVQVGQVRVGVVQVATTEPRADRVASCTSWRRTAGTSTRCGTGASAFVFCYVLLCYVVLCCVVLCCVVLCRVVCCVPCAVSSRVILTVHIPYPYPPCLQCGGHVQRQPRGDLRRRVARPLLRPRQQTQRRAARVKEIKRGGTQRRFQRPGGAVQVDPALTPD